MDREIKNNIIEFRKNEGYQNEVEGLYHDAVDSFYEELTDRKNLIEIAKECSLIAIKMMCDIGIHPEDIFCGDVDFMLGAKTDDLNDVLCEGIGLPVCVFTNGDKVYSAILRYTNDAFGVSVLRADEDGEVSLYSEGEWVPINEPEEDVVSKMYPNATELQKIVLERDYGDPERSFLETLFEKNETITDDEYNELKREHLKMLSMAMKTDAQFAYSEDGEILLKPENCVGIALGYQDGWKLYQYISPAEFMFDANRKDENTFEREYEEYKRFVGIPDAEAAEIILGGYESESIVIPLSPLLGVAYDPDEFDINSFPDYAKQTANEDLDRNLSRDEEKNMQAFYKWYKKHIDGK